MMHRRRRTRCLRDEAAEVAMEALCLDVGVPLAVEDVAGVLHARREGVLHFLWRPLLTVLLNKVASVVPTVLVSLDALGESVVVKPFVVNGEETARHIGTVALCLDKKINEWSRSVQFIPDLDTSMIIAAKPLHDAESEST